MAERRMFTGKITESDAFLEMPLSTQALYFHLCMNADDDGFVKNPKRITKMIGANEDDLKLLMAKAFVIFYDTTGVIVIKHWRMHNLLRKDRYKETEYLEEKSTLFLKENGAYTLDSGKGKPLSGESGNQLATSWQPSGNQLAPQDRLGKDSIGELKESKHKHGTFKNVLLTDAEYERLKADFGEEAEEAIELLSGYIKEKGYKTKDHNLTIRRWVIDAVRERKAKGKPKKTQMNQMMTKETDIAALEKRLTAN